HTHLGERTFHILDPFTHRGQTCGSAVLFPTGPLRPARLCRFRIGAPGVVPGCALWAKAAVAAKTTVTLVAIRNVISVSFAKSICSELSLRQDSMGMAVLAPLQND